MNIHCILYRTAAYGYGKPSVPLVKAVFPLSAMMVNLPCLWGSCPNFLRPTCSYTECQRSSYAGSLPHGKIPCRLQLLFVDLNSPTCRWCLMALNYSADAKPASPLAVCSFAKGADLRSARVPSRDLPDLHSAVWKPGRSLEGIYLPGV